MTSTGHDRWITTVLIADQQRMFSDALAAALAQQPDLAVFDERPVSKEEVVHAVEVWRPQVALIDYWLEGVAATRDVVLRMPECKVLVLSGIHRAEQVREAIAAGAVGFLPKAASLKRLTDAIRRAREGEPLVYAEELHRMVEDMGRRHEQAEEFARRLDTLSKREYQVLVLLSQGKLIQEIAKELAISQATVKSHISSILKKTDARTHAEVLAMARQAGIIQT